jgi:phosphopantetheinyl transferase
MQFVSVMIQCPSFGMELVSLSVRPLEFSWSHSGDLVSVLWNAVGLSDDAESILWCAVGLRVVSVLWSARSLSQRSFMMTM